MALLTNVRIERMKTLLFLLIAGGLLSNTGCETNGTGGNDPQPDKQTTQGYVSGKATDAIGKPLANVKVVVNNTQFYNHNILGQTDASGRYKLQLTPGSWYVRGTTTVQFDNKRYVLDLHPDSDGAFAGTDGAVRNLSLQVSGERTGEFGNDGYYGGQIEIFSDYGKRDYFDTEDVELTLEPVGTLLDGSAGMKAVRRPEGLYVNDVPLGKYRIAARHRPDNQPMQVRIRNASQAYKQSVTDSFDPAYPGAEGRYKLNLEVSF